MQHSAGSKSKTQHKEPERNLDLALPRNTLAFPLDLANKNTAFPKI